MGTTILRMEKIKSLANIRQSGAHQFRHHKNTPNADPAEKSKNHTFVGSGNLVADVKARLETLTTKPRRNAVLAMDGLIALSPELLKDNSVINTWANRTRDWLKDRFGRNLVSAVVHLDESSPHMHYTVVPLEEKNDGRRVLNARDLFDKWALADMQRSYNQAMQRHIPDVQPPKHGAKAQHTKIKHFYAELDAMADSLHQSMLDAKEELMTEAKTTIMDRLMPLIERQFKDVEQRLGTPIPEEMRHDLMEKHKAKAFELVGFAFEESKTAKCWDEKLLKKVKERRQSWSSPKGANRPPNY
ncbi:MobV family relaxase [Vibrio coralliilyticus]|uniref:MobV family relaxase n=1 Tax=Vibrio coralliilyticus TaxID=190893 RepID=UPI0017908F94|nr:MobV family relaxase [Vibrio coralliilyticus]NUW66833.1 plasmid recombination protein [Vibrio coralliilyticus]